jgi:hypothetical protein
MEVFRLKENGNGDLAETGLEIVGGNLSLATYDFM